MHTTMHSQNTGGRKERQLQIFGVLQLGTQVVPLINFIFNCKFRFLINITTGQTSHEYPYFGYADRCNAVVAGQGNKAKLFQRFLSQDFSDRNIKIVSQQFVNPEDQEARRTSKPNFRNFNAEIAVQIATV